MTTAFERKRREILDWMRSLDALVVAYSGGVDSGLLLALAREALGDGVVAVTARSAVHATAEVEAARAFAAKLGVRHQVMASREMDDPDFRANSSQRCYICKKRLFADIQAEAEKLGIATVVHGANGDDLKDFRPGMAAAAESGIVAPLLDAGLTKREIRKMAAQMDLPFWDRPAMACLATRIPYGTPITEAALQQIEAAESALQGHGFSVCRVRHHGQTARIEVPPRDLERFMDPVLRSAVTDALRRAGFVFVALDLEGYRSGRMNEVLHDGKQV